MKFCIALLFLFALTPISNVALAGSCGGGDHIHTDEQKKEKKSDA